MLLNSDTDAISKETRLNNLTLAKTSWKEASPKLSIDWRRQRRKIMETKNGQKSKKAAWRNSTE